MPFIAVNGAKLYYETFGERIPGKAPIVLIHGSTGTGRSNWSEVAPLLACQYYVIVPDCRGHGKSNNPKMSYSFKEMANDTATLVRSMGFERAHIIGHSNGGNVAVVVLLEHPELVQSCILQAANAWVSPDLPVKEPALFDPERVEREVPEWRDEIIAQTIETYGKDYWRTLLKLTVDEIISEPNYSPEDLQEVSRPTLVIQGELDRVNAPFKHAQWIAHYIPEAELWTPLGTGHNVHKEKLFEWIEKVLDFLKRRGDDDNDAIYRLGRQRYADERDWIFDIHAENEIGDREVHPRKPLECVQLIGKVLVDEQKQAAIKLFEGRKIVDQIQVLLTESTSWALVKRNVTDLRRSTRRLSERTNQALMGEAVRILEDRGEWVKVRLEEDGYIGWVKAAALNICKKQDVEKWRSSCTHLVCCAVALAFTRPDRSAVAGLLPFGVALPAELQTESMSTVRLPDGSCWWVLNQDLLPISKRPKPEPAGYQQTLAIVRTFVGTPYLWGGRTPFGYDCSGLSGMVLHFSGLKPKRDAGQQFILGEAVTGEFLPGDLLFFGEADEGKLLHDEQPDITKNITHVAISLGGSDFIHSTGASDSITINSLDPKSPLFSPWLKEHLAGVRRFL